MKLFNFNKLLFLILATLSIFNLTSHSVSIEARIPPSEPPNMELFQEVFVGHNDAEADRINMIFAFDNTIYDTEEKMSLAKKNFLPSLGWSGEPEIVNQTGLVYGVFAIEPMRSYKNKFNLWFYNPGFRGRFGNNDLMGSFRSEAFKFKYSLPVYLGEKVPDSYEASGTAVPLNYRLFNQSWTDEEKADYNNLALPKIVETLKDKGRYAELGDIQIFDIDYLNRDTDYYQSYYTLSHEIGHALFDLADEYDKDYIDNRANCAVTEEEAMRKWGDLIGQYDSFVDEVLDDFASLGNEDIRKGWVNSRTGEMEYADDPYEQDRIGIVKGCYNDEHYSPNNFGMMSNGGAMEWGLVNRRQMEAIMSAFSGEKLVQEEDSSSSSSEEVTDTNNSSQISSSSNNSNSDFNFSFNNIPFVPVIGGSAVLLLTVWVVVRRLK